MIPNCHLLTYGWCCSDTDGNGLWFNETWPADRFVSTWQEIATRYADNRLVAAMDIKNEPRHTTLQGMAVNPSWGDGSDTDIAAMYTAVGNLIHQVNPHPLIICEGLNYATDLTGVKRHPVQLERPGKVVYSMHDYSWFHAGGQSAASYADQMNTAGGYVLTDQIAPLWIGEFGNDTGSLANFGLDPTSKVGNADNGVWWTNLQAWVTGGLLASDWHEVGNLTVLKLLKPMIRPRTGPGIA